MDCPQLLRYGFLSPGPPLFRVCSYLLLNKSSSDSVLLLFRMLPYETIRFIGCLEVYHPPHHS